MSKKENLTNEDKELLRKEKKKEANRNYREKMKQVKKEVQKDEKSCVQVDKPADAVENPVERSIEVIKKPFEKPIEVVVKPVEEQPDETEEDDLQEIDYDEYMNLLKLKDQTKAYEERIKNLEDKIFFLKEKETPKDTPKELAVPQKTETKEKSFLKTLGEKSLLSAIPVMIPIVLMKLTTDSSNQSLPMSAKSQNDTLSQLANQQPNLSKAQPVGIGIDRSLFRC
jgi:hypothetical protein